MDLANLIVLALFVEAIVQTMKPIWDKTAGKITVAEIVSMGIGIVIAVVAKMNFFAGVIEIKDPILLHVFYVLTGIALGRGPSFVHDLWVKIRTQVKA